jgi:branched-chain amino acid transport system permease protein
LEAPLLSAQAVTLQVLNGLTFAALLFMLASGFTLIFGLMRIMNLTHGGLYLVGGYVGLSVLLASGNLLAALLVAGVTVALLGVITERFLLRRLRGQVMPEVLLTIGLAFVVGDLSLAIWGGDPKMVRMPGVLADSLTLAGITYPVFRLVVFLTGLLIAGCLWYIQERTRLGAIIRAGVDDREMVDALGVNVYLIFTLLFAFGAFLAGMTGVMGSAFLGLYPGADFEILLFALVVVIIGGPGSLLGAVVGSLAVGLIDSFATVYTPELKYFSIFLPMALILMWRPYGLFGRPL